MSIRKKLYQDSSAHHGKRYETTALCASIHVREESPFSVSVRIEDMYMGPEDLEQAAKLLKSYAKKLRKAAQAESLKASFESEDSL